MEKAKNIRRAAKGTTTRSIGTVRSLIELKRPWEEIKKALDNLSGSFEALIVKHEEYTLFLNDEEYEEAELWMEDCTREFNSCNMIGNDYIKELKHKTEVKQVQDADNDENVNYDVNENDENVNDENVNDENANDNVDHTAHVNDDIVTVNDDSVNVSDDNVIVSDHNVIASDHNVNANGAGDGNASINVHDNGNVHGDANSNVSSYASGNVNVNESHNANGNVTGNHNVNGNVSGNHSINGSVNGSYNGTIFENVTTSQEKKPILSVTLKHEKPKLPNFNGDVRKYFIFKDDFKHAVESRYTERDAITILRSCLGTEPAKLVEGICNDLKIVWRYLDQAYGDPRVVSDVITSDLEKFRPIQPGEDQRFCELVNLVRRSYNILKEIRRPQDIDNTHVISLIERKLTREDQRIWARSLNTSTEPSMATLLEWLEYEMCARKRSGAGIRKSYSNTAKSTVVHVVSSSDKPNQSAVHTTTIKDAPREKPPCYVCQNKHYVDQCPRFKEMSCKERWKVVKDKKACFCCLKISKDHSVSNCRKRKECGELSQGSTCTKFHHKLLHSEPGNAVLSVSHEQGATVLPVAIAIIKGKGELREEVNVFFDSGAQVSMIRCDLAESLGLEGKRIRIVLTKVGGTEEELDTMLYKMTLYNKNNFPVQAINAIGIPQISDDVTNIDVDLISKKFRVPAEKLRRKPGPIDILVGINYPKLHVGETTIKDGLVLREGPLGYVVFGMKEGHCDENSKQVMFVRVANPVDITDIWKTESMGVNAQPCTCRADEMSKEERKELTIIEQSCKLQGNRWEMSYPWKQDARLLPNNYDQVLKKLETTERRLRNNMQHAESYDKQIKEMERVGFRKKVVTRRITVLHWPSALHLTPCGFTPREKEYPC